MGEELATPNHEPVEMIISWGGIKIRVTAQTCFDAWQKAWTQLPEKEPGIRPGFHEVEISSED